MLSATRRILDLTSRLIPFVLHLLQFPRGKKRSSLSPGLLRLEPALRYCFGKILSPFR